MNTKKMQVGVGWCDRDPREPCRSGFPIELKPEASSPLASSAAPLGANPIPPQEPSTQGHGHTRSKELKAEPLANTRFACLKLSTTCLHPSERCNIMPTSTIQPIYSSPTSLGKVNRRRWCGANNPAQRVPAAHNTAPCAPHTSLRTARSSTSSELRLLGGK